MPHKKSRDIKIGIAADNKCSFCEDAKCCRYVTQEIDPPRIGYEFEVLVWQALHKNVEVYKDADKV